MDDLEKRRRIKATLKQLKEILAKQTPEQRARFDDWLDDDTNEPRDTLLYSVLAAAETYEESLAEGAEVDPFFRPVLVAVAAFRASPDETNSDALLTATLDIAATFKAHTEHDNEDDDDGRTR